MALRLLASVATALTIFVPLSLGTTGASASTVISSVAKPDPTTYTTSQGVAVGSAQGLVDTYL